MPDHRSTPAAAHHAARSIAHVPGLDGLRGLAVAGVLLFHANERLRGGYLGVDLFFVLSGFLITSILVAEYTRAQSIDLRAFWIRRARRLLPALLALVPAIALYAKLLAAPDELASLRSDALATLAYVANWRAILARRSYWEMFTAPSPLEHTWSLAIEEQFYVVWPLVVLLVLRLARGRVRVLLYACIALGVASALTMAALYDGGDTTRVYLGTDTRGAAILFGAALATSGIAQSAIAKHVAVDVVGAVAFSALAWAWWSLDGESDFLYRGGFWLTELAALVLVVCAVGRPRGVVARTLSFSPFRWLGTISYGVYLWHWPVYVVLSKERVHLGEGPLLALRLAVTLVIALVSYRYLEKPIRERGLPSGRPILVTGAAFAAGIAAIVACTRTTAASTRAETPLQFTSASEVVVPPPPSDASADAPPLKTMRVLVVGDSVGLSLGGRMYWDQTVASAQVDDRAMGDCSILDGVVPVLSMGGYPHGNGDCSRNWVDSAKELRPDVTLVVLGGAYFSSVRSAGKKRNVCERAWHEPYVKTLAQRLDELAPHTRRRVVLLAAYPGGKWQTEKRNDEVDCYNGILREAATNAGADVLDLAAWLCPNRACTETSRESPVRPDGLHFDGLGAVDTSRWVLGKLREGFVDRDE
ncbi:acyltransferase family protein [soil metagenome]